MSSAPTMSTPGRLISAAGEIFARDGFHRAGVREICKAAGDANLSAVQHTLAVG